MVDSYNHSNTLAATCRRCFSQNEIQSHFERARRNVWCCGSTSIQPLLAPGQQASAWLCHDQNLVSSRFLGISIHDPGKTSYPILKEPSRLLEQQYFTAKSMPTLALAPGLSMVVFWHLLGMPGHVLLLCHLPALRQFCCLCRIEELTRHVEEVTLFFLDMLLDMLF